MKKPLPPLITLLRPRYWAAFSLAYVVGILAGATGLSAFTSLLTLFFLFYFTAPVALFVEGTKRYFLYESKNDRSSRRTTAWAVALTNLPWFAVMVLLGFIQPVILIAFLLFLFLVIYSYAPPIRAVSRPVASSIFAVTPLFPAFFGYRIAGGADLQLPAFAALTLGLIALHAFKSTITPKDTSSWISLRGTLFFSLLLFLSATALSLPYFLKTGVLIGLVYSGIAAMALWVTRPNFFHRRGLPPAERVGELWGWLRYINILALLEIFFTVLNHRIGG